MSHQVTPQAAPLFKSGDVICKSDPWVFSVYRDHASAYCYFCLKNIRKEKAPIICECKFAHYCTETCQTTDHARHGTECPVLGEALGETLLEKDRFDDLSLIVKVILKLKASQYGDKDETHTHKGDRTFNSLFFDQEVLANGQLKDHTATLFDELKRFIFKIDLPGRANTVVEDLSTFRKIYGKIIANAMPLSEQEDFDEKCMGQGLYLGPSDIDHSCRPNATSRTVGKTMIITATCPIRARSEVRIPYINVFQSREDRRHELKTLRFFDCQCQVCQDPEEAKRLAFSCISCGKPVPLDHNLGKTCSHCSANNTDQLFSAEKELNSLICVIETLKAEQNNENFDLLRKSVSSAEKVLHPTNFALGIAYKDATFFGRDVGLSFDEAVSNLKKTMVSIREHLEAGSFSSKIISASLANMLMEEKRMDEAIPYIKLVQEGVSLNHGQDSELFRKWVDEEEKCRKWLKNEALKENELGNKEYKAPTHDFNAALQHYEQAIVFDPDVITYHSNKAAALFEQGKYQECIEACNKGVDMGLQHGAIDQLVAKALYRTGKAYLKLQDYDGAAEFFGKSLAKHHLPDVEDRLLEAQSLAGKQKHQASSNCS